MEHTFKSYDKAIAMGADYIEQDLQLTKDGHLIISHDSTVDRITGYTGNIRDMSLSEIKELRTSDNQEILTLKELFDKYGKSVNYYIETKRPYEPDMDIELVKLLKEYDLVNENGKSDNVIIQSFSDNSLKNIRKELPEATLIQLTKNPRVDTLNDIMKYANGVGPTFSKLDKNYVQNAQARNLLVHPYTVNTDEDIAKAVNLNVDGFFTNYPDKGLEVVKKWR